MNVPNQVYLHLANGDFNDSQDSDLELGGKVEFEINAGCQSWILVTAKKLTVEQYGKIQDFIDKTLEQ